MHLQREFNFFVESVNWPKLLHKTRHNKKKNSRNQISQLLNYSKFPLLFQKFEFKKNHYDSL